MMTKLTGSHVNFFTMIPKMVSQMMNIRFDVLYYKHD